VIVVVSYPDDPHAERVIGLLRQRGEDVLLLNVADLPHKATLTIGHGGCCQSLLEYRLGDGPPVDLSSAKSVWWRRPQVANVSGVSDHNAQVFAAGEWHEAVAGVWQLMPARWVNPPAADEVASHKAYQLRVAAELGLRIPRTLMTSDPDRARAFIEDQGVGQTIFKTFSCTYQVWRETRPVRDEELRNLDALRLAPVIFQEYIEAEADLRVTVVGDQVFAAAIHAADTEYPFDFRMVLGQAKVEAVELPAPVREKLLRFMRRLGLVYGAIDLRRTSSGEHVFLEINTAGEFLFVEERAGLPVSAALADWLATPAAH
jgi:ribosomal protein S6-L-glutamate ligase RimK-like protein